MEFSTEINKSTTIRVPFSVTEITTEEQFSTNPTTQHTEPTEPTETNIGLYAGIFVAVVILIIVIVIVLFCLRRKQLACWSSQKYLDDGPCINTAYETNNEDIELTTKAKKPNPNLDTRRLTNNYVQPRAGSPVVVEETYVNLAEEQPDFVIHVTESKRRSVDSDTEHQDEYVNSEKHREECVTQELYVNAYVNTTEQLLYENGDAPSPVKHSAQPNQNTTTPQELYIEMDKGHHALQPGTSPANNHSNQSNEALAKPVAADRNEARMLKKFSDMSDNANGSEMYGNYPQPHQESECDEGLYEEYEFETK